MSKNKQEKKSILQRDLNAKEVLTVLGVAGAIVVYGVVFVYPRYTEFKSATDNLVSIDSQIKVYEEKITKMPKLRSELEDLESELGAKSESLAHNMQDGMFLIGLSKVMDENSVDLVSYYEEEPVPYETFYGIPTSIEIRGDYRDIREVMSYMETQKNMTQILDYSMESHIEEPESSTNISETKIMDSKVYWTSAENSEYHKEYCGILHNEMTEGKDASNGSHTEATSDGKSGPCDVCKPYTVSTVITEVDESPNATGEVVATFKFIMYSANTPTLDLKNDDANNWDTGKSNPFKTSSR